MGLSSALNIARSGLTVAAQQTDLISRNIANSKTEGVSRKWAELETTATGGVQVTSVERSVDSLLQRLDRSNGSKIAHNATVSDGLKAYTDFLGQPRDEISPAAMMADFHDAIVNLSVMPGEEASQIQAVTKAKKLAEGLNGLSGTLTDIGQEVERNIRYDVASANEALENIAILNQKILRSDAGSSAQAEHRDKLDQLLNDLAGYMDIQTVTSDDGTVNVYTGSGTELVVGRKSAAITYDPIAGTLSAGDVDITPGSNGRGISQGSLGGLFDLKANHLPKLSEQLDALAGALITGMETANPFGTAGTGLFTDAGAAFDAAAIRGLAGRITVNAEADSTVGGDPSLLQSGGVATTPSGDATFVTAMLDAFGQTIAVDPAGLGDTLTLSDMAPALVSQQQSLRANAEASTLSAKSAGETIAASRANFEGVNIDDEMQKLLVVEQSYRANARVMTSISEMMDTLLQAF